MQIDDSAIYVTLYSIDLMLCTVIKIGALRRYYILEKLRFEVRPNCNQLQTPTMVKSLDGAWSYKYEGEHKATFHRKKNEII